jgi:hypothetical protein
MVVAYNPYDSTRLGISALPNASAAASGGLPTFGTGAGQINVDGSGNVYGYLNVIKGQSVTASGGVTFPAATLAYTTGAVGSVTSAVTVGTNNDKTGYSTTYPIHKNTLFNGFQFPMTLTADHVTPYTGAGSTVSGKVALDGAAAAALTNSASIAAVSGTTGIYTINLSAADLNGNNVALIFSAPGCDDTKILFVAQP